MSGRTADRTLGGMKRIAIAATLLALLAGCTATPTPKPLTAPTTTITMSSTPAPARITVDPANPATWPIPFDKVTPGSLTPACTYPRNVAERDVTAATKRQAAAAYGYVGPTGLTSLEYDHRIPFALCGSNGITNIWPEVVDGVSQSTYVHNRKDQLEAYAAREVRYKHWTLTFAQSVFVGDWRTAWCKYLHYSGVKC